MTQRTIGVMARLLDQDDGLGVYGLQLLRELLRLDAESRYLIFLDTSKSQHLLQEFSNAETLVLPSRSKLYWDQVVVPRAARANAVDLIFNPKFSVPLMTRIPCVFVHQGSDWYVNPANYPWWDNLYIRIMLPLYHRKAARTLSISRTTLLDLTEHTRIDVNTSTVTYAGVAANFTPQRDEQALLRFRAEQRLPPRYIFTVARAYHIGHKHTPPYPGGNNERLMRGYLLYRREGGTLPLVVAGSRIKEYLLARGFTTADLEHVHFLGFVPNAQIHMAFQLATCFVLATLCESFGIPIVEALATGCPAIVPRTCASPEIAGGAARLVDPRDVDDIGAALTEVTSSAPLRTQMRARGLQRAQHFTWQETARRTLAVFNDIVPITRSSAIATDRPEMFQARPMVIPSSHGPLTMGNDE